MYTIEYRNLFGDWELYTDRQYDTIKDAVERCAALSDSTNIAYRVVLNGEPVETVDFEREFFNLGTGEGEPDAKSSKD